jgi:hypothetical protein
MKAKKLDHSARKHSRISPSGLYSLKLCPGHEGIEGSNSAADRGTLLHEIMDAGKLPAVKPDLLDDDDMKMAAQLLLDLEEDAKASEFEPIKELELNFTSLNFPGFEKGHLDRLLILEANKDGDPVDVELTDFKFGRGEVENLRENIQFRAYALGVFLEWPSIEKIRVRIRQPALHLNEVFPLTRAKDFEMIKTQVGAIVKRRMKFLEVHDQEMLKPDPGNCTYCSAQTTCPIWQQFMVKMANDSNLLEVQVAPITGLEDPETADPDEVLRVYRWLKPMEEFLRKFKKFALAVYDTGRMTDQFSLVEKAGSTEIVDLLTIRDYLKNEFKVTEDEFLSACSISMEKIKGLINDKTAKDKGKVIAETIKHFSNEGLIQYGQQTRYLQLSRKK